MSGLKIMIAEVDKLKYTYTAEIELAEGIYAAKEYIDAWLRQAVDGLGESRIEVQENENR